MAIEAQSLDQWRIRLLRDALRLIEDKASKPLTDYDRDIIRRCARAALRRTEPDYEGDLGDGER